MPVTVPLLAFGAYPGRAWLRPHGAGLRVTRRHVPVTRSIHRMTVSLAAALLAEATGIMLLRYRLGRAWLRASGDPCVPRGRGLPGPVHSAPGLPAPRHLGQPPPGHRTGLH